MGKFLLGVLLTLIAVPIVGYCYLRYGHPPVAVADAPFWQEAKIVHIPLNKRIDSEAPKAAPIEASAPNLEIGAHIYREQCAACHGLYGRPSPFGNHMYPGAPQLWTPHGNGVVGVSDDPPGETYWKVANGIRLTGMPSFSQVLNETQMWQVSLLLANADKTQPPGVLDLMKQPIDYEPREAPMQETAPTPPPPIAAH
jgi:thiosulfate dehydrogenase